MSHPCADLFKRCGIVSRNACHRGPDPDVVDDRTLRPTHVWRLVHRRVWIDGPIRVFVTRWECDHCGARCVVQTPDPDILWLFVEVPEPETESQ